MRKTVVQCVVALLVSVFPAVAGQIVVGSCAGAAASTIQDGVNLAAPGDTVSVCPGTYAGGVIVRTASVIIEASGAKGAVMVVGSGASGPLFGFDIVADNVQILGFDISGFSGSPNASGIFVGGLQVGDTANHANGGVIENNVLHANSDGIYLWQSNHNVVEYNEIYGSIDVDGSEGIGIQSISGLDDQQVTDANVAGQSGTYNNIAHNLIHDNDRQGVYAGSYASSVLADLSGTQISENQVYGNGGDTTLGGSYASEALSAQFEEEGTMALNNVHDNPTSGILLFYTSGATVEENTSSITGEAGILVFNSEMLSVNHNQTNSNSGFGIFVISSSGGVFDNNTALGNASFDLGWDSTGSFVFQTNTCGTATPSTAVWGCN